jgi:hypothetical protein
MEGGIESWRWHAIELTECEEVIGQSERLRAEPRLSLDWKSRDQELTGMSLGTCLKCHVGQMVCIETILSSIRRPSRRRAPLS